MCPARCVVNDCLVENVTGTYGLLHAMKFVTIEINGGRFRNITMKDDIGYLAAVNGDATASIVLNPTPAGQDRGAERRYLSAQLQER